MLKFLRNVTKQWASWVGDSDLERTLRTHLTKQGYFGGSAKFSNLRLVAVQRPGWLQVFSFSVVARESMGDGMPCIQLFGIVRQDERYGRTDIELFSYPSERNERFEQWSEDLVRLRRPAL